MSAARVTVMLAFGAAFAGLAVLEWWARRPGATVPTIGDLAATVLGYRLRGLPVGRIALLGFWWWVGWHFLAR